MKYENRLIWVLGITFGFLFFDRNAVNYLMSPFIADELHFSNLQVGLVGSALSFTWAIFSFVGGAYSDRTGHRKIILLTSVVAFSLCSFFSGLVSSFLGLFLVRMLMGAVEGPFLPVSQSLMAVESAHSRRGHNMGVLQNFGSNILGSFAAPIILVSLATAYSWRTAFYIAGIPGLIMAVLIARYVHDPKPAPVQTDRRADADMRFNQMLRYRNMWLCMLMSIVMVAWMVLGWIFLPRYYIKVRLLTPDAMKWMMSVLGLSAAFFSFIVPRLSDRFGRRPVVVCFNLIGLLVPLVAIFYSGSLYVLGALIFIGWSASGTFPLFMATIPSETIPARYVATSLGMVVGLGEILGGVLGPAIAGWAADLHGLRAPLLIQGGCAIVGTLFAIFLRETAPVCVGAGPAAASAASS